MLALDLDGTLIARDGRGAAEAREPLRRLSKQGVRIAIATGRMMQSARQIFAELGISEGHIIALNGAELWTYPAMDRPLWQRSIAPEAARKAIGICLRAGAEVQGYVLGELRILRRSARAEAYARRTRVLPHLVDEETMADSPQKLLALLSPEGTDPLIKALQSKLGDDLRCFHSEPDFVEIVAPGVHKGAALRALGEILGVSSEETAAAGDGENDVEMLRSVGRAFAPETAADAVKALAPQILPPPPDLAIALCEALTR